MTVKTLIDKTRTLKLNKKVIKRPTGVEDIDKDDHRNPFLLSVYTNDIHNYLKSLEVSVRYAGLAVGTTRACALMKVFLFRQRSHTIREDYLNGREITPKVRSIVIDWLVEVQQEYHLLQETLHIAVGILDTYLQVGGRFA